MALANAIIKAGNRASQPAAAAENHGCLYMVTDEGNILERSNGSTWDAVTASAGAIARALTAIFDGGGAELEVGATVDIPVPFACTITAATLVADQAGDLELEIETVSYAGFPGSLASIVASAPPALSSADKSQDTTLTGWTTAIGAGTIVRVSVTSAATITRATLTLTLTSP